MDALQLEVTKKLVQINTIKISPESPFTWASGWKSPIYCDNRKVLSYPEVRTFIYKEFAKLVRAKYPDVEVIAGVATGAIAHGVLVAEELGLPFVYVRATPKGHGLENLIEGDMASGQKVVVIEDLVSTGISSLKAAAAIRNYGGNILGMMAIFTYDFPQAHDNFKEANIELTTLSNYPILLEMALANGDISSAQKENLDSWRKDPSNWGR